MQQSACDIQPLQHSDPNPTVGKPYLYWASQVSVVTHQKQESELFVYVVDREGPDLRVLLPKKCQLFHSLIPIFYPLVFHVSDYFHLLLFASSKLKAQKQITQTEYCRKYRHDIGDWLILL